jgi:hypothetical protein
MKRAEDSKFHFLSDCGSTTSRNETSPSLKGVTTFHSFHSSQVEESDHAPWCESILGGPCDCEPEGTETENKNPMRTTRDLITELTTYAEGAAAACLVVAFRDKNEFCYADDLDDDPLERLCDLMEAGGKPVGLVRASIVSGDLEVSARPLAEHAEHPDITDWLGRVAQQLVRGGFDMRIIHGPTLAKRLAEKTEVER